MTAAIEYLAGLGERFGEPFRAQAEGLAGRRGAIRQGMLAIKAYEQTLSRALIEGLSAIKGVHIRGITDLDQLDQRVPTVIFEVDGKDPAEVATRLGEQGIYVWDGNYYALAVMERLGLEEQGGMIRVGPVHYNTHDEIERFLDALDQSVSRRSP